MRALRDQLIGAQQPVRFIDLAVLRLIEPALDWHLWFGNRHYHEGIFQIYGNAKVGSRKSIVSNPFVNRSSIAWESCVASFIRPCSFQNRARSSDARSSQQRAPW